MPAAQHPPDELQRLTTLRSYQLLDTPPEPAFDDIVQLASTICNCPVALISLVDEQRQWFKASVGLDAKETARDAAFCAHAILNKDELLVVPDAQADPRFSDNPLVTGAPHIRTYVGAPLVTDNGSVLGTLCVIDFDSVELNQEQLDSLAALGRQVGQLIALRGHAIRLDRSREELAKANQALKEFTYAVSHDLKQPLRGFNAVIDFVIEDHGDVLPPEAMEQLDVAKGLADRAERLLHQLLRYSRVDSATEPHQEFDLRSVVNEIRPQFVDPASGGAVEIAVDEMPSVFAAPGLVEDLLHLLISNAIRFNDRDVKQVHIGSSDRSAGRGEPVVTAYFVADNGIGIPQERRDEAFTMFRRLHAGEQYSSGLGAGLALAKKIVQHHGGKLWIDPDYQPGTCFWFTLGYIPEDAEDQFRYENQQLAV